MEKGQKEKRGFYKKPTFWVGLIITIIIIIAVGLWINYLDEQSYVEQQDYLRGIHKEFQQHVELHNKDTAQMNAIMDAYNGVQTIEESIFYMNKYIEFYNLRINHLEAFYKFVVSNEYVLKEGVAFEYPPVDTFSWKTDIKDTGAFLKNNIDGMKSAVESYYQAKQIEQEQYAQLLQSFGSLAGLLF